MRIHNLISPDDVAELISSDGSEEINLLSQKTMSCYSNFSEESIIISPRLEEQEEAGPSKPKKARGTWNIMNIKLVAA